MILIPKRFCRAKLSLMLSGEATEKHTGALQSKKEVCRNEVAVDLFDLGMTQAYFSGEVPMGNKMKPGGGVVNVLIVAQPSRFRDGLKAIVQALTWVGRVSTLAQWTAVSEYVVRYQPALVIFDVDDLDPITWVEAGFLPVSCQKTKCIAIIDREQQRSLAQDMGMDAILLRGFTTDSLYDTMRTLIVAYDPEVPVTGPLGQIRL